jgi:hypothetical protein
VEPKFYITSPNAGSELDEGFLPKTMPKTEKKRHQRNQTDEALKVTKKRQLASITRPVHLSHTPSLKRP